MTATTAERPVGVTVYLARVRAALADLPAGEREELLAEVEASLLEDPEGLDDRLGSPERFAGELRAAAGLEDVRVPPVGIVGRLRARHARIEWPGWLPRLAPLWWAVRGWVVVVWLLNGGGVSLVLPQTNNDLTTLLVYGLGVGGSIALGLSGRGGRAVVVANVLIVLMLLPLLGRLGDRYAYVPYGPGDGAFYVEPEPSIGLQRDGQPVENIYVYDRRGEPLFDVQLFDQNGAPLAIGGEGDETRRYLRTSDGTVLLNAFPIRYFEPGTQKVAEPLAGVSDSTAVRVATPPLPVDEESRRR